MEQNDPSPHAFMSASEPAACPQLLALILTRSRSARKAIDPDSLRRMLELPGSFAGRIEASGLLRNLPEARRMFDDPDVRAGLHGEIQEWRSRGIGVLTIFDEDYPALLASIFDPPWMLFYRGARLDAFSGRSMVAVVGARAARHASAEIAGQVAAELARGGACVVSGLAAGIDAAAHRGALRHAPPGSTIAVLGNGLNTVYPVANSGLADEILECGGLLLSEYEPGGRPYPSNFLARNRIIAGMCKAVIVVQAAERSGSLVTARFALEAGRDVLAVPGAAGDGAFKGSNKLIKAGAYLLCELEELYEFLPELRGERKPELRDDRITPMRRRILTAIADNAPIHLDRLAELLKDPLDRRELHVQLVEMELEALIERLPGNYLAPICRL